MIEPNRSTSKQVDMDTKLTPKHKAEIRLEIMRPTVNRVGKSWKTIKTYLGIWGEKGPCMVLVSRSLHHVLADCENTFIYIYNVKSIQKYAKSILPPSSTSFPMADVFLHVWTQSPAWPGSRLQWSTPNSGQCPPSRPHLLIDGPRLSLSVLCRMTRVHAGELILLWSNRATKQFYLHISRVSMLKLHYMKYRKYMEIRIGQFLWKFWLSSEPSPERCRTSPSESSSFATWNCSRFNAFDVQSANPRLQWLFSTKIP